MRTDRLVLAAFMLAIFAAPAIAAGEPRVHTVLLSGIESGEQVVEVDDDGTRRIHWSFNDRGRGPETVAVVRLDPRGLPVELKIEGVDYMKADAAESFTLAEGISRWQSTVDGGETERTGFYLPLDFTGEMVAMLARAALLREGEPLPLLPTGAVRASVVDRLDLDDGRTLRLVELNGLQFEPTPVWLDEDDQLFALVSGWFTIAEPGAEGIVDELKARQDARRKSRFEDMAQRLREPPRDSLLIDNARIWDVRAGRVRPENAVLVAGNRIERLLAPGDERPAAAAVVDARGRTLLPGLWDMHTHLDFMAGPLNIAAGVTTVRDLNRRCTSCHGGVKRKGGFSLLYRSETLKPAKSGEPPIVPGDPDKSGIHYRITTDDEDEVMPPEGDRLKPEEVAILSKWIKEGAPYAEHWAYVAPEKAKAPKVKQKNRIRNHIDPFILEKLEAEGLRMSPEAPRHVLLRRLHLDLTGLPPAPEDVDRFLADSSDDAYEKEVDRLLASPKFGERWAGVWLDLARYADTQGYEKDNARSISPYRDWVIRAFNRDLNFRDFTIDQLAGDLLPDATEEQRVATGFHRNTMNNTEGGTDNEEFRVAAVLDRVNTTWDVWMGTTIGCVQCHNHPYDPFVQKEYFEFMHFFNSTADEDRNDDSPYIQVYTSEEREKREALQPQVDQLEKDLKDALDTLGAEAQTTWEEGVSADEEALAALPENVRKVLEKEAGKRSGKDKQLLENHYRGSEPMLKDIDKELKEKKKALDSIRGIRTLVMKELETPRDTHVFNGGNWLSHGDKVERETPDILPAMPEGAARNRLGLARWIVSAENPLTARVTVNRFWEQIFGNGIVESVADFGTQGIHPTHPALLDDLAVRFATEQNWSVKALLKSFVMSATYRQSSHVNEELLTRDPRNQLLARGPRYRLSAEQIRDQAWRLPALEQ